MKLIPINPENINLAWKDIEGFVESGLKYCDDKYNIEDIYELIISEQLILWVVYNDDKGKAIGCLLTQVLDYPQVRSLSIFLAAGINLEQIMMAYDDLINYAKAVGCRKIELYGRHGWERVLSKLDFVKTHTVMRLNL